MNAVHGSHPRLKKKVRAFEDLGSERAAFPPPRSEAGKAPTEE
jgi:hypothetical protein